MPKRLGELLPRWLREVPLYRRGQYPLNGHQLLTPRDIANWPFITKKDIRHGFPQNFLRSGQDLDALVMQEAVEVEHTSGTSQERTPLLLPKGWWAQQELRALRLNPVVAEALDFNPEARRISIVSPMCNNDICYTGVPSRSDRIVGNALFLSLSRFPFLWTDADLERMAGETDEWAPVFLDLDPVYGVAFARYCQRKAIRFPSLRFIICSYEFVSALHRRLLERVFKVPVFNLYGSTETGHLLMEVPGEEMRPSLGTAALEIIEEDSQGIGELVVTTLTNDYMPLIRYRIGDLVQAFERPSGISFIVHSRVTDAVQTSSGRVTLWQIDQCIAQTPGLIHYQLLRTGSEQFTVRFIPEAMPPTNTQTAALEERLSSVLEAKVVAEPTDLLMPEASGKFRLCYPEAG